MDLGAILGPSWGILEGLGEGLEASWRGFGSNIWIFWIRYDETRVETIFLHVFLFFLASSLFMKP